VLRRAIARRSRRWTRSWLVPVRLGLTRRRPSRFGTIGLGTRFWTIVWLRRGRPIIARWRRGWTIRLRRIVRRIRPVIWRRLTRRWCRPVHVWAVVWCWLTRRRERTIRLRGSGCARTFARRGLICGPVPWLARGRRERGLRRLCSIRLIRRSCRGRLTGSRGICWIARWRSRTSHRRRCGFARRRLLHHRLCRRGRCWTQGLHFLLC